MSRAVSTQDFSDILQVGNDQSVAGGGKTKIRPYVLEP